MAFQAPNAGQARENRKLLEQLEEQRRRMRMAQGGGGGGPVGGSTVVAPVVAPTPSGQGASGPITPPVVAQSVHGLAEPQHMTPAQRTALIHAQSNSVGYYITQDSSFGNLILPVLPRFNTT